MVRTTVSAMKALHSNQMERLAVPLLLLIYARKLIVINYVECLEVCLDAPAKSDMLLPPTEDNVKTSMSVLQEMEVVTKSV